MREAGNQINAFVNNALARKKALESSSSSSSETPPTDREAAMQSAMDLQDARMTTQIANRRAEHGTKANTERLNKNASKISKFMRKTTAKRRARFLNSICSDSGVCIAFGTDSAKILDFFNGFKALTNVSQPVKRIGVASANGFVDEIAYSKFGYSANAVLKSSRKTRADNLMYEYYVGTYLNEMAKAYPCFVETYAMYRYNSPRVWTAMEDADTVVDPTDLRSSLTLIPKINWRIACTQSKYICILTQHLKGAQTLSDLCNADSPQGQRVFQNSLLSILFQIYAPLSSLGTTFTHYDLHWKNVLLYEPVKGKYIQYYYHGKGAPVMFKSQFIAKIIDYGRSYFFESAAKSSAKAYHDICAEDACDPECGRDKGLGYLKGNNNRSWIVASKSNVSHDLRLLTILLRKLPSSSVLGPVRKMLETVQYGPGQKRVKSSSDLGSTSSPQKASKGTEEVKESGAQYGEIYNVMDAYKAIKRLMQENGLQLRYDNIYNGQEKLGDLHVYMDGSPMKFIAHA